MSVALLQSTTALTRLTTILVFLGAVLSIVLSLLVLLRALQGYRRTRDVGLLTLALGIALLSGGSVVLNLALTNATSIPHAAIQAVENLVELAGLVALLAAIYCTGSRSQGDGGGENAGGGARATSGSERTPSTSRTRTEPRPGDGGRNER